MEITKFCVRTRADLEKEDRQKNDRICYFCERQEKVLERLGEGWC